MKIIISSKLFKYFLVILLLVLFAYLIMFRTRQQSPTENNHSLSQNELFGQDEILLEKDPSDDSSAEEEITIPDSHLLQVPFTSQAPPIYGTLKNSPLWDDDHDNACEEASILMVHYFLQNQYLSASQANNQILAMLDFQQNHYLERNKDLESEEVAKLAEDFYGYDSMIKYDVTIDDIKKEIATKNPVILPTAGRLLGNPNFRNEGPLYHMLVAIGYDSDEIITNDPGTKNGKSYRYSYETLLNSLHEWNESDVYNGRSAMIILK